MSGGSTPVVIQTEHLDQEPAGWLAERTEYHYHSHEDPAFEDLLPRVNALVVRTYTMVNEELLDKAPNLKVVGRAGVALENIDIPLCRSRGVEVVHTPGANTQAVVELVWAFMLDAKRPRAFIDRSYSLNEWGAARKELIGSRELADCAIGIIGFGRIGSRIAQVSRAMGVEAKFCDVREISAEAHNGATQASLDEILSTCDIITVHVDDRPSNSRFLNASKLSLMKSDALFINTSRGFVIDSSALASFLRENPAAQAILDVHDPEPVPEGDALLEAANCWQSPHIGAATATAHRNMSWVVRDVWRVLNGEKPESPAPVR
ncbi:MAG: NAD(P)-dependent oxidoreductase [Planctomycetota bacterium]